MDALHQACHVADAALAGQRLDAALAVVLEALGQPVPGLRGRRRLLEEGRCPHIPPEDFPRRIQMFRNVIDTAGIPRVTVQQTPQGEKSAPQHTKPQNRSLCITGTGRIKPAHSRS